MTTPEVYIIESLDLEDEGNRKEGEVLSRTLSLSGKKPIYRYIRTKKEFEYFIDDFGKSGYRYLHISCHGNEDLIHLTMNKMSNVEFSKIVGGALAGRRLFMSACLVTTIDLASKIFAEGDCRSVAGPVSTINFDDSTIFWSAFYHLMFKKEGGGMANRDIVSSLMVFGWALAEQFRFFMRQKDGSVKSLLLPSRETLETRIDGWLTKGM